MFRHKEFSNAPGHGHRFHLFTKYTASIGKLVNYWRENLGDFINTWEKINGTNQPSDKVNYRRCPLRLVSNRWGSIHSTELFILQRKRDLLQPVLLAMLSKKMKAAKESKAKNKTGKGSKEKPDLLDDDSRETYNIKLSKWASGACAAVLSSLWWLLLEVSQKTRGPLTHFLLWCQSESARKQSRGIILELVTNKANQIMCEFRNTLLSLREWFQKAVQDVRANDLPEDLLHATESFASKLILESASDFYMRVVRQTEKFPLKLLWMNLSWINRQ